MLLHRPSGTKILPKADWHRRVPTFKRVNGPTCFAKLALTRPRSRQQHREQNRASRTEQTGPDTLCNVETCQLPGTQQTFEELRDPSPDSLRPTGQCLANIVENLCIELPLGKKAW